MPRRALYGVLDPGVVSDDVLQVQLPARVHRLLTAKVLGHPLVGTESSPRLVITILSTVTDLLPPCPECSSEYTYELAALLVCPECAHEWEAAAADESSESVIKDAVGNVLTDGDTVIVIKDLKVKGSRTSIKVGTKVRNIRLVDAVDGHDVDCKVDGFGSMQLKSSVLKKV